jgi:hypothetical protein
MYIYFKQKFLSALTVLLISINTNAQIKDVQYMLRHSDKAEQLDLYLIIKNGETTSPIDRVQFNSQISLVVPKGIKPSVAKNYMPLNNNMKYEGNAPCKWKVMSYVLSPEVTPDSDYYSIIPELHPTSFYNDLKSNDTIKLFTIEFKGAGACIHKVRLFDNDHDPRSEALGMNGADFVNTFTIGGTEHVYSGNALNTLGLKFITDKESIQIEAKGKSYQWYRVGEGQILDTTAEPSYRPSKSGRYYVKVISDLCEITSEEVSFKK